MRNYVDPDYFCWNVASREYGTSKENISSAAGVGSNITSSAYGTIKDTMT